MTKKRVYQLAKELGISSKILITKMEELKMDVSSHMSTIEDNEEVTLVKFFTKEDEKEQKKEGKETKEIVKKETENTSKTNKGKKNKSNSKNKSTKVDKVENTNKTNEYEIEENIKVNELADLLGVKASELIGKLMMLGVMANINQEIEFDTASLLAEDYGVELHLKKSEEDKDESLDTEDRPEDLLPRSPIVTVMGHVDHGKTSLLDAIRETNVTSREAGGITQHIGASTVEIQGNKIVFLDTPGHEAFTSMRARGAQVTDIAILVVAADDGVMPQTIEAINHAKAANVPIIVAVNKIDKEGANPDRVKQELTEYGLIAEDWGGDTITVPVSALKNIGIEDLLEMVLLVAEMQELKANPNRNAVGTIIEARLDKGKGSIATVLVEKGTLRVGESVVTGVAHGKVRAMIDSTGKRVKVAGPSTAVEILGLSEVPDSGDKLYAVESDKIARNIAESKKEKLKQEKIQSQQKVSLDDLFSQIQTGEVKDLNVIIKADVRGSIEAVKQSLIKLSNEEVKVQPIHGGVGAITDSDIMLASASNAIIIGFNVRPTNSAIEIAKSEKVDVRTYRIIYKAIEDIEAAIKGMLDPEFKEVVLGRAVIRATFKVPNAGIVAGVYVQTGKVTRNASLRLLRDNIVIHEGKISSLRRFKDDVKELNTGYEGGLGIDNYNDVKDGDVIEAYIMEEVKR